MKEIANGIFIETAYEGVNVGAVLTGDGVVGIDVPSYPQDARDWVNRLGRLHGRGLRYLVLTDYHGDRILNTRWMNVPIIAHKVVSDRLSSYDRRYPQQLLDNLIRRNPQLGRDLTSGPVDRTAISFAGTISLYASQNDITLLSKPGPTAGNIWVSCTNSEILFTGDSVVFGYHPPLSEMCLRDWLASLDELITGQPEVRLVVPGRGEPCSPDAIEPLISYLRDIEDIVNDHIAGGGSRLDLDTLAPEIAGRFPSYTIAPDWTKHQVSLGLQRVFDELFAATNLPVVEE